MARRSLHPQIHDPLWRIGKSEGRIGNRPARIGKSSRFGRRGCGTRRGGIYRDVVMEAA